MTWHRRRKPPAVDDETRGHDDKKALEELERRVVRVESQVRALRATVQEAGEVLTGDDAGC